MLFDELWLFYKEIFGGLCTVLNIFFWTVGTGVVSAILTTRHNDLKKLLLLVMFL